MLHRYDLSIALLNGSSPVFYNQPQEPVILYPRQLLIAPANETYSQEYIGLRSQLDDNLVTAYQIIRRFCLMVNTGTQTQQVIDTDIVHETMTSVMYRLINMNIPAGAIDKAVQLALLAFSYHLFIQWQDIRLPYQHFPKAYQDSIQNLEAVDDVSPRLMIWLLMTGAISVFDISNNMWLQESLRDYIHRCQVETWTEMRDILDSFIWNDLLDKQLGKQIYDSLCNGVIEKRGI
jgi:hypothetical protein